MSTESFELGDILRDRITGFKGVAVAKTEFMFACRRWCLQPDKLHDGKPIDDRWFDEPQLEFVKKSEMSPILRDRESRADKPGGPGIPVRRHADHPKR